MTVQVQLVGRNSRVIEVSGNGELVVAQIEYSSGEALVLNVVNTAFNFHIPTAGKLFVITGFIISTSRNIGVNGANIEFYEASAIDTITVDKSILRLDMIKNTSLPIFGGNIILTEGAFLNCKTDDADVLVTIAGYEVDA